MSRVPWLVGALGLTLTATAALSAIEPRLSDERTGQSAAAHAAPPHVVIETDLGDIEADIDVVHAPITAANFMKYVEGGFYDGGRFFRTVRPDNQPTDAYKIEVIQVGANAEVVKEKKAFPPIPLERTKDTGLRHVDGALSMARSGPDTATSSFSIVLGEQPSMDFGGLRNPDGQGVAVFGRVVRGMDVARKIQAQPADGQRLTTPVTIKRIRIASSDK
jgi:peptidyl-prolyl cis-trans isomerase A (cyclophilin A)